MGALTLRFALGGALWAVHSSRSPDRAQDGEPVKEGQLARAEALDTPVQAVCDGRAQHRCYN